MPQIVLFNAPDQSGMGLWMTDGTAAGTVEISPIAGAGPVGVNPQYLTNFNGEMLFQGRNTTDSPGLWVTNGTAAGTSEITGISGANPMGLGPGYMQVYDGVVLLRGEAGVAGNNVPGLWETNGTATGTVEIGGVANAGINNAFSGGLVPSDPDFTVFKGVALFAGRDAANNIGLWETDGTPGDTFELAPIAGAFAVGSPGSDVLGSGRNMTVLGNKVLFRGTDLQDTPGSLWETDGTPDGTIEIGGQGNAAIGGSPNGFTNQFTSELPLGIQPADLTTFNNVVVFAGYDNTLKPNGFYADTEGLWVSDGTAPGTFEIGGIGNAGINHANPAQSGGIFWSGSIEFPDFTVYNGKVLFVGLDDKNHVGLWETDGTPAGTVEIGGVGNAGIQGFGHLSNTSSPGFTVANGVVLFNAFDSSNRGGLWETDGTPEGTHVVATFGGLGVSDLTLSDFTDTTIPAVAVEASMYGVVGSSTEVNLLSLQFLPAQVANAAKYGLNTQVYACEVLGLAFAFGNETASQAFGTQFGPSNSNMPDTAAGDQAFAVAATNALFGSAQNANTPLAILGFVSNWKAFYTSNGVPGIANPSADQIDLSARAAAWGDAVGVVLANNLGVLPGQALNFFEDAAKGTAIYSAPLSSQPHAALAATNGSAASAAGDVQLTGVAATSGHATMWGYDS
jgi:ELWxxDGT repeat protein